MAQKLNIELTDTDEFECQDWNKMETIEKFLTFCADSEDFLKNVAPIILIYEAILKATPGAEVFAECSQKLRSAGSLEELINELFKRREFATFLNSANPENIIRQLYVTILGRPPDTRALQTASSQIVNGTLTYSILTSRLLEAPSSIELFKDQNTNLIIKRYLYNFSIAQNHVFQ